MDQAAQETVETTKTTRGRRKATTKKTGVAAAKTVKRTRAVAAKSTRAPRKQAISAAQKAPRKTTAGRKKGGRRKTRAVQAAALPDSVMIALEIDGKQATVSITAAKNLYDSLCRLFG